MFLLFYTIISLVLGFVLGIGLVVQNISSISMYNSLTTNPFVFFGIGKGWVRIVFFVCVAFTLDRADVEPGGNHPFEERTKQDSRYRI